MKDLNNYWKENISGKRILITGGTTGIGREITILLASFGAKCFICGRNEPQINETIAEVGKLDSEGTCTGIMADLSKQEDIDTLFNRIDSEFGGIDVLINNAALGYGSVTEGTYQDWSYIIHSNLLAYLACSHEA